MGSRIEEGIANIPANKKVKINKLLVILRHCKQQCFLLFFFITNLITEVVWEVKQQPRICRLRHMVVLWSCWG